MKRRPEREQLNRSTVNTLDQVFIMRVKERLYNDKVLALVHR